MEIKYFFYNLYNFKVSFKKNKFNGIFDGGVTPPPEEGIEFEGRVAPSNSIKKVS